MGGCAHARIQALMKLWGHSGKPDRHSPRFREPVKYCLEEEAGPSSRFRLCPPQECPLARTPALGSSTTWLWEPELV